MAGAGQAPVTCNNLIQRQLAVFAADVAETADKLSHSTDTEQWARRITSMNRTIEYMYPRSERGNDE